MSWRRASLVLQLAVCLAVLVVLSRRTLLAPPMLFGDGVEYVLQTQAIVFDQSLAIEPVTRGAYFNLTNPYGKKLLFGASHDTRAFNLSETNQLGGGFGSLYPALDGSYRYVHSWIYSAAVAPFYAVFHILWPGALEYKAFIAANLCFLMLPFLLLWALQPCWASLIFLIGALGASPYTPFLQWAHSEVFCAAGVMTAFALLRYERLRSLSSIPLAFAAAQNIPLVLLFPFHAYLHAQQRKATSKCSRRNALAFVALYLVAAAIPLAIMCQSQLLFGEWNVIPALGFADTSNVTLQRITSVVFSPIIGFVWYYPFVWVALALVLAVGRWREALLCAISMLAVIVVSSTTNNISSAQLSTTRYSLWFVAVLWTLPFYVGAFQLSSIKRGGGTLVAFAVVLCGALLYWFKTHSFISGEWSYFAGGQRTSSELATLYRWSHFEDDVEVLVENIKQMELFRPHDFSDIYIWNLGCGESMWVVSKRAFLKLTSLSVDLKVAALGEFVKQVGAFTVEQPQSRQLVLHPNTEASFLKNPHLGSYLIMWLPVEVSSANASVRVFIANQREGMSK